MTNTQSFSYSFTKPFAGTITVDDVPRDWTINAIEFSPIEADTPVDDELVLSLHRRLIDQSGNRVPVEVLAKLDLRNGLLEAFRKATDEAKRLAGDH